MWELVLVHVYLILTTRREMVWRKKRKNTPVTTVLTLFGWESAPVPSALSHKTGYTNRERAIAACCRYQGAFSHHFAIVLHSAGIWTWKHTCMSHDVHDQNHKWTVKTIFNMLGFIFLHFDNLLLLYASHAGNSCSNRSSSRYLLLLHLYYYWSTYPSSICT